MTPAAGAQGRSPGPVAARLRAWLGVPDVIADPEQTYDDRVWTRAQDVLPGVVVHDGEALTAAWGDRVWTVQPSWDEAELDGLWLVNLDEPSGPPDPVQVYGRADVIRARAAEDPAHAEQLSTLLLEDLSECLAVMADTEQSRRHWAAMLLDDLHTLSPDTLLRLDDLPSGRHLRALARRPLGFEDDVPH